LDSFDPEVMKSINKIQSVILTLNDKSLEEVIDELEGIKRILEETNMVDEDDKKIGLAAASVAIESSNL